jgi:hypothetical protein
MNDCGSMGTVNDLEQGYKVITYRSVLFPAPASRSTSHQCEALVGGLNNIRLP